MKKKKIFISIVAVLLLIVLLVAGFVASKLKKIDYNDGVVYEKVEETVEESEEILVTDEEAESLGEAEVILSEAEVQSDKDIYNILLLGTDEKTSKFNTNARADSIMILSLNKKDNTTKLVSLQRGMGVPILEGQYEGEYDWITHLFRYGGADLMMRTIKEVLNVEIEHYVRVNPNTFRALIDAIGGTDIVLTAEEAKAINLAGQAYSKMQTVYEGLNHLDGYNTFAYTRLRSIDSDWKRVQRQRNVIQSLVTSAKDMSFKDLNNMLDTVLPLVQTNLTTMDILGLISYAPAVLGQDLEQMTIPVKGTYGSMKGLGGRNLYAVDFQENSKILHEFLYGVEAESEAESENVAEDTVEAANTEVTAE